ncbi:MAG TPA: hypothetical protein VJS69_09385 [Candidatus Krumholzibacteria bacterium]|nr:hypothetical protein [Candidatus Krumholzibacteria bacterium]
MKIRHVIGSIGAHEHLPPPPRYTLLVEHLVLSRNVRELERLAYEMAEKIEAAERQCDYILAELRRQLKARELAELRASRLARSDCLNIAIPPDEPHCPAWVQEVTD